MLLRIVRGRVMPGQEEKFVELTRRQLAAGARAPGLVAFICGYRRVERTERFVLASSWQDEQSIVGLVGADPIDHPSSVDVLAGTAIVETVEHFELVEPIHRGILDAPGAIVRTLDAEIKPGMRAKLMAWLDEKERELHLQRSLLGWSAGIRADGDTELACSVSAWASPLQIEQLAEPGEPRRHSSPSSTRCLATPTSSTTRRSS